MAYNKRQKLNYNIAAIKLVLQLRKDSRAANDEERAVLRKYSGFGGLKFILNPAGSDEDIRYWKASDRPYFRAVRELYDILHAYSADAREEQNLLSSIKRSVTTAFYTPDPVIMGIVNGLKEGNIEVRDILDPSAGTGKFGDAFQSCYNDVSVTSFEKDILTGHILQALHPHDAVTIDGFETIPVKERNRFDLVTSNIPFGDIPVFDPEYNRSDNLVRRSATSAVHNYFFLKSLDMVRHGGLVAFITSRGVMDSASNANVRAEMLHKAHLVTAIRLPDGMFRDEAGTDVGSDLIVLQRDDDKTDMSSREKSFVSVEETLDGLSLNSFFSLNKECIFATDTVVGTDPYGKSAYVYRWDKSLDTLSGLLSFRLSNDIILHQADILYANTTPKHEEAKVVDLSATPTVQQSFQQQSVEQPKVHSKPNPLSRPGTPVQLDLFSMWDAMNAVTEDKQHSSVDRKAEEARLEEERRRKEPRPFGGEVKSYYRNGIVVEDPDTKQLGVLSSDTGPYIFTPLVLDKDQTGRLRQYILVRDAYHELYNTEAELREEQPDLREALNRHYDNFFLQYGRLNERKNVRLIMMDALGRDGLTLENEGESRDFVKADIFERPVSFISYEITHVDTPEEALFASLNRYGKVNLEYMASLTGNNQGEMQELLKGQIYYMPDGSYEIASKAISGNVYEKLEYVSEALDMIKGQEPGDDIDASFIPALEDTKAALEAVIPEQIAFDDIGLQFGERWIPTEYYEEYVGKLFDTKMEIHYAEHIDEYSLKAENRHNLKIREEFCIRGEYKDYDGMALLAHAFHNTIPDIQKCVGYDENGDDLKGPDMDKIQLANTKIEEIRDGFTEYLTNLPIEKRDELQEMYNRKFNCFVKAKYDGSYQTFPGIDLKALASPKFNIKNIYKSQKDCVKMILENGGGICDHEVGTGKSLIMCMAAHEMHRLGIVNKPMILAMKANVAEIAATYQAAFPHDKILYASEKDFSPANRVQFFNRIKNNDYACVIMSHDQFGKIPQALEVQQQILWDEIRDIDEALDVIRQQGGNISGRMLTGLEKRKENMQVKLMELQHDMAKRKDDFVDFGRMGIDHLFIDESHQFKNLMFTTRHQRVSGLGNPAGSQKALNLLYALRTIQNRTGKDLGATFLSGTTISNSLTELYLLFKYLRPKAMAKQGIHSFDAWAAVYAKKTSDFEFTVTNAVAEKERFRFFVKVPELATFYNEITDYRTGEDVGLDRPNMNVILHDIEPTADQQDFNERLVQFAQTGDGELIFRAPLNDREMKGKMLIATDASRKASMDMRLVSQEHFGDDPNNKASHCARLVSEYYQKFNEQKGTQFIFSDLSTYKPNEWNIFQEIKDKLVNDYGIPASEIRFIQEASSNKAKQKMIDLMNEGKIRVLFGSTSTLGTGVNAQQRAVAVHHIDIPWRPSDFEQRNGRARRTGNWVAKEFAGNNVDIIIYAVKRTLDSYKFNLLQNKQLFITQLKTNQLGTRVIDEGAMDEENGMNFAEYVAILSGNDDLLQKAKLEKKVMALESERKTYMQARRDTERRLENVREKLGKNEVIINGMTEDYERYQSQVKQGEDGSPLPGLVMNNVSVFTADGAYNIEEMGAALQDAGRTVGNKDRQMGTVYGFPLMVDTIYMYDEKLRKEVYAGNRFYVKGNYLYEHNNGKLAMSKDNRLGAVCYGVNALEKIPGVIAQYQERNEKLRADISEYERIAGKPWGKEVELKGLKKEVEALDKKIRESLDENTKNMPKAEEKPYKFSKEGKWHKVSFARDAYPLVSISEMREFADTGNWRNRGYVRCGHWDGDVMVSDSEVEGEFTFRQKAEEFISKVEETNNERKENFDWLIVKAKEDSKGDKVYQDNEVIFAAREALQKKGVDWQNAQESSMSVVTYHKKIETDDSHDEQLMKRSEQVEVQQLESEDLLPDAEFYFNILQDYFESVSHDRLVKSANGLAVVQKTYTNYPDWNHRYTVMENMRSMAKSVLLNNGFEGDSVSDVIEVMMNHCLQVDKQRDLINMQLKEYEDVASEPFQINSSTDNTGFFHEHQPVSFGDAIAASREPLLTYSVRSSSSAYYNSVELQREVEAIGSLDHVLAGYEDYKTGDYVFVGKSADVIFRARALGTLQDGDDMTKDSVYTLPMGTDAGHKIFDSLSAKLVNRGYRFGIIGADKVRDLVERPESLDIDVVHPGEREGNVLRLQDRKPRVTSAIQLDLFGSEDFITPEENEHPVAVNVLPGEVVSNIHINDFDPTQLTMRHLDDGEQCYVERRYTENGYFSFVGGDHIESDADVAYIFRSLEDKSVENSFICMVKDGNPTVIHLGIGDATSVMAPIQDALLAYKALEPDKIWFIHNHPSGNLKVSREDYRLQERMEKIFGAACQPGIIINTTSGKFMAYTSSYDLDGAHYIRDGKAGNKAVRTFSFDRNVFEKGWDPFEAFNGSSYRDVAKFVSSHRLGEREKLSLLVMNNNGNITGNIFLPWTNINDVCSNEGVDLISQTVLQMGGNRCLLYGSEGAILDKELKALNMLQNRLRDYSIALHDVTSVERSLRMEGLLASESMEHSFVRDGSGDQEDPLNTFSRRLSVADREAGGALVDHLLKMGIPVHTDNRENRRILREAFSDHSEIGKVRFFNNDAVESYGFAYKGEIHLDMRKVNAELPLHEYAHLWCEALRRINPDNWRDVVSIMKNDAATWQFVKKSYPELSDDDDLAEEVIAHYSGKRGAEKLQKELERMTPRDANYGSRWGNIFKNVSKAIQDFWKHIGDSFNFKYDSKEDIADQILNDFSKQVNPVKKVERWLKERDKEYAAAVERGDTVKVREMFNAAMQEHVGNGVTPFIAVDGYRGKMDRLARAVKSDGLKAINEAADLMSLLVPDNAVLVPAPSHVGYATDMLLLANAIGMRTNSEVADVLKSAPRDSQYDHKINSGKPFTAEELGIHMEGELPEGKFPVVIDNVVNTGNTAEACVKALGGGLVLSLASAVSQERHVSSLKSASPVVYDKQGQLIPLSERFELKNKWLGRIMNYKDIEQIQSALQDQPINVISIGKRMEILTKESVRSIENTRVGYSKMITDGKDAEGCEHLERTIFYDDRPLGDFKADVFPQGQATVSYLLDVRVHPLDMADNAWEGIDDMELDDEYDYGCIRFEDEATMIAFYESHQEEIDYRNGRYNYIEEVATTKGKIAAETLSLNIPVQYLFKPVPPMRDWVDIKTDKSFLNLPQEEQERLLYRKGESVSDYKNRNHLYWGDTDFAFYFWQKYADRQDEVKSILVDGITVDNYQEVSQKIASLVDSKDEGYAIRSLLNYNKLPDQERFYEAFEAAFEQRMINIPEYPVQKQVQGLESYTIDEIKNLVRNHIEDNYGELLMDDGFVIKEISVIGSRSRGEAHEGSDLDILLEYDGNNIREDVMFNILNFEPLEIEGIKVDINPINPHYSLTTEEWLARDARWREEDRKKAIVQPIEKENVESKNIRSMQISVIKSNLQVLADSLLPDTQSRVHFLKPQDPKLPSAVGGEIYRRDDGIHLFRENKDVLLSSIDDRDELNDLYRSLLEYSITERIGNGNAMNFPDSPNVDGYKISVAAVVDGNLRVMGTRDGDQANNSSYITNEGLKELIGIIDKRIAEDENIYDNLSVAGSVNGQKENRSDVLSSIEKEVIHSIIRGNGNRADLLEGEEYDRLLHEVHETEISMLELTPLSDRQRDILREISNSFDGGVHEFAKEMNVDVENIYAALDENVLSGKSLGHDFENMYSIKMIDHDRYSVEFDKSIVANLDENYLDYLAINTKGGYNGISDKVARFFSHEAAENYAEAVLVASRPVSAKLRDVLDAVMPNVGDSIPLYMKERTVFDPALFTRYGSVTREGQFDYHVVTNNPDADYHYDSIMCNASDEIIRDLYRQALREELVGKIGVGHAVTDLQALGNSYSGDHSDAYVREGSLLVISGKYYENEKGHPSQYIHDWITCPLDILERTSLELSKRLNIDKEVVNVKENSVGVDSADKSIFHDKPLYHTQEERPYRISYGDDPTGVIEGDIHVHFTKELASLSFDEFEHLAEDMGGSARQMSGERWADFFRLIIKPRLWNFFQTAVSTLL